jgi:cytochrome P450
MGFARLEMTLALAALLRAVRLAPVDAAPPRPRAEITLRPQPPLRLVVRPRD